MSDPTDDEISEIQRLVEKDTDFLLAMAAKPESQRDHREAIVVLEQKSRELLAEYVKETKRIAFWTCVAAWSAVATALVSVLLHGA